MVKDQETKIIPSEQVSQQVKETGRRDYAPWLIALVAIYFVLMLLVSFLPLTGYMKVLSLILGTFLVFDLHHSIKHYVRTKQQ